MLAHAFIAKNRNLLKIVSVLCYFCIIMRFEIVGIVNRLIGIYVNQAKN